MSKKNIVSKIDDGKRIEITFENGDGNRTYEFKGNTAAAIRRGKDPATLIGGKLIRHDKND